MRDHNSNPRSNRKQMVESSAEKEKGGREEERDKGSRFNHSLKSKKVNLRIKYLKDYKYFNGVLVF